MKALVAYDQCWTDGEGFSWIIRGIHRKDGCVRLERSDGRGLRFATFAELGSSYQLQERMP